MSGNCTLRKINYFIDHHKNIFTRTNIIKISFVLLVLVFAIIVSVNFSYSDIKAFINQNQGQTILISLLIYILFGFTFLPSVPLTLFLAVLIGPLLAAIVATLGNTIAALLEYQIGKTVGDVVDFKAIKARLPFGLAKLPIKSPYFLLAVRSVPAGTRGFSMVCGAYHVPLTIYTWTTFLMYGISSVFLAYGGTQLINLI
jgi:uncharacterized membrane protein YdjX (TVP38/TMEM64 family)